MIAKDSHDVAMMLIDTADDYMRSGCADEAKRCWWNAYELEYTAVGQCKGKEPSHSILLQSAENILVRIKTLWPEDFMTTQPPQENGTSSAGRVANLSNETDQSEGTQK